MISNNFMIKYVDNPLNVRKLEWELHMSTNRLKLYSYWVNNWEKKNIYTWETLELESVSARPQCLT